jgi:thymidylate synthase (FAD)
MESVEVEVNRYLTEKVKTEWKSDATHSCDALVEIAGRLCYDSFNRPRPGGWEAYINNIREMKHGSVLEHAVFSFIITGVSRSLTHELVRHRAGWSYSQESQRYCDNIEFIEIPLGLDEQELSFFKSMQGTARAFYVEVTRRLEERLYKQFGKSTYVTKMIRQTVRYLLPNMTATRIYCTANARALRHFFELRGSIAADMEIRELAIAILEKVKTYSNIFDDIEVAEGIVVSKNPKI